MSFGGPPQASRVSAPGVGVGLPGVSPPLSPTRRGRRASVWLFAALGFVLIGLVGYFVENLGALASGFGFALALIPLSVVLLGVRIIDRWEPEPRSLLVLAVLWGAIAAAGLALLADRGLQLWLGSRPQEFTAVIQAPLVEETAKGMGVLLILFTARRAFDGPVDGIVYGALIGAGFAFTENIQYFAVSMIEGGGTQLTATFVMRALISPFAHAMFTAVTGFAVGLAARRVARWPGVLTAGAVGGAGAVLLHALWNASALFADFFAVYLSLHVPLFVGFVVGILALRAEESRVTRRRLGEYADAGWFTPEEVTMLATPAGRRAGMAWAASLRGDRRGLMRAFIRDATALAAVRQRALSGRDRRAAGDEQALLMRTRATREALLAY